MLAAVTKNFCGRVARSRTGETWWEARFSGDSGYNLEIKVDLRKVDSKLKNRTRTSEFADICEEHTAFRVVLFWLWRKWIMHTCEQAGLSQIPSYVRMCLEPLGQDDLQPCPLCKAGKCTIMVDLPARLSKLIGPTGSTSKVSAKEAAVAGDGAAVLVAPASSVSTAPVVASKKAAAPGDGAAVPVAHASCVCCCCGAGHAKNQSGIWICRHCGDIDMVVAISRDKVSRAMPKVASNRAALPLHPGTARETCNGGPGWELIRIPGNGDCFFTSMAIGKLCLLQSKAQPAFDRRAHWGPRGRTYYLSRVDKLVARGGAVLGVASFET